MTTTTITALVCRDKRDHHIISIDPIVDSDTEVEVEYTSGYVSEQDLLDYGKSKYAKQMYSHIAPYLDRLAENNMFTITECARYIPSIGNLVFSIEQRTFDSTLWDEWDDPAMV